MLGPMLRPSVKDDRGARRPLGDPRHGHLSRERIAHIGGTAAWNLRQLKRAHLALPWFGGFVAVIVAANLAGRWWLGIKLVPPLWAIAPVVVPLFFIVLGNSDRFAAARLGRERIARSLTRAGLCAGCGYPIVDLDPEPDGCQVCPECGGAWRVGPRPSE